MHFALLLRLKNGQRDVIFHGKESYGAYYQERQYDSHAHINVRNHKSPIGKSAYNAGHGVYLLLENDGHIVEQDIAYDASGRTGDASHDYGNPERMAAVDGFLKSGNGEQGQSEGVEKEPGIVKTFEVAGENYHKNLGHDCTHQIDG